MKVIFGLSLDGSVQSDPLLLSGGTHFCGPTGLLLLLESHLGLSGHTNNIEYLRIEEYRQALKNYLDQNPSAFFARSFAADQLATATELLNRRDELLLANWDFSITRELPPRLATLASIEKDLNITAGFADRFQQLIQILPQRQHPITAIHYKEPDHLMPRHFLRLFHALGQTATPTFSPEALPDVQLPEGDTDLSRFQNLLTKRNEDRKKLQAKADGSLLLLEAPSTVEAAAWLARLFRKNEAYRPFCLIPEKNRTLDEALVQEGLPSLGILSASLARPSLQLLKLAPSFLWKPVDPFKILEFVALSTKPIHPDLANVIAAQIARRPGVGGENWNRNIEQALAELNRRSEKDKSIDPDAIEKEYRFWFQRDRYSINEALPKKEAIGIFEHLQQWAYQTFNDDPAKHSSLLVLSEQSKRIVEILRAFPEQELSNLELERIVRTIYEPSPVVFQKEETGHLPYVYHPGSMLAASPRLLWWNFFQHEPAHFFSRWYRRELAFLESAGIRLDGPADENQRLLWYRSLPVLQTTEQAVLIIPKLHQGSATHPHPLMGDLEAGFEDLSPIRFQLDLEADRQQLEAYFRIPAYTPLPLQRLGRPKPFLKIEKGGRLQTREYETFTSLDALFYYPYKWMFQYQLRLRKSSILSVVPDETLMGNLAHRLFEQLFQEKGIDQWNKTQTENWVNERIQRLFEQEGAVLLLYGREPERVNFINRLKFSAWSLLSLIRDNNWTIKGTEQEFSGMFMTTPVRGIADLVLQRGNESAVIDLKWRGAAFRERMIKNEEDLQLILYARLLPEQDNWAHTAYFIMQRGKMIARNQSAFSEIQAVSPEENTSEVNDRIWTRMEATYLWRQKQLERGEIEIRCAQTLNDLEDHYLDDPNILDLLEMKDKDAPYDDYRTLINLID